MSQDIRSDWREITDPYQFLENVWEGSTKNKVAINYFLGAVDALLWAKTITPEQAETLYIMVGA